VSARAVIITVRRDAGAVTVIVPHVLYLAVNVAIIILAADFAILVLQGKRFVAILVAGWIVFLFDVNVTLSSSLIVRAIYPTKTAFSFAPLVAAIFTAGVAAAFCIPVVIAGTRIWRLPAAVFLTIAPAVHRAAAHIVVTRLAAILANAIGISAAVLTLVSAGRPIFVFIGAIAVVVVVLVRVSGFVIVVV